MEIIRDDLWNNCLMDAMKMYRVREADDKCYNLADATWKMKMSYKKFDQKKESRKIIVLDKTPADVKESRAHVNICQATTMTGKRCSFKAVCGQFCKKHRIDKVSIGSKIKIGD
jgi:hypothetical protein